MKNTTKTYSSSSNAKRAAKAAGIAPENIVIRTDKSGAFYFESLAASKPSKKAGADKPVKPAPAKKTAAVKPEPVVKKTEEKEVAPIVRKSSLKNPVQESWEIFDKLRAAADKAGEKLRRKDAIAVAVKSGIAFYTARTQYQSWKTANKF